MVIRPRPCMIVSTPPPWGKMDAIQPDLCLDSKVKICILIWERNAKLVKQLETVQVTAAKKVLGWSSTTGNTVLRAELGIFPLKNK